MRALHEKLHRLREGIAGDAPTDLKSLLIQCYEVAHLAWLDDPKLFPMINRLALDLKELKKRDTMEERVRIDQYVCEALNDQEIRVKAVPW